MVLVSWIKIELLKGGEREILSSAINRDQSWEEKPEISAYWVIWTFATCQ
jgi:hypothetical protein